MTTGWKKPRPRHAGPWSDGKMRPEPRWAGGFSGHPPAIGGSGRQLLRGIYADRREAAYQKMVDSVSNRWRTHKP